MPGKLIFSNKNLLFLVDSNMEDIDGEAGLRSMVPPVKFLFL